LPNQLIELANDSAIVGGIVLVAAEQDTAKPIFSKVISPQTNEINVEFSHQITENTMLRADAFKIIPMEESLATPVIFHVYPQAKNRKIVNIDCRGMVDRKKYKLEGRHLESIFMQTADSLSQIFAAGESDTIAPSIAQITPDPSEKAYINGFEIELYFSESIDPELSDGAIKISDSSGIEVGLTSKWKYPNRIIIKPQMKDAEQYNMAIDGTKIVDMQGNRMSDSVVTYKYTTASADTLGLISGRIVNIPGADIIVMAYPQKGDTATTKITENGSFSFPKLFPSTYYLSAYWDVNRNNQFDAGHVKPIIFSELMAIYEDTVVVRSRWETDIGQFDFNKQTK